MTSLYYCDLDLTAGPHKTFFLCANMCMYNCGNTENKHIQLYTYRILLEYSFNIIFHESFSVSLI